MSTKFSWLLAFVIQISFAQNTLPIIPYPQQIQTGTGFFTLTPNTVIKADPAAFEAQFLQQAIVQQTGLRLQIQSKINKQAAICLQSSHQGLTASVANTAYNLQISPTAITINAPDNTGVFYGIQTLLQLLPTHKSESCKLAAVKITDKAAYAWRGLHLDCARHFFSVEFIKKYLDYMAMYKFNTFHWHLTDDQGWRIQINQYPKITEIGAWRNGSMMGHYQDQKFDSIRYGGFYTQEDIKQVVAYASQRHITVVPEIEMPGHAMAALAAYPEFSCTGGPFDVAKSWGVLDDVFCPKEETITFLEHILSEVMALFPSPYLHIGGDECPKTRWKNCPRCQLLIQQKGLKDEHELQSYFVQRIEKFVNSKGRKIIGWDEILEGGLAPNAGVMSWRGTEGGIAAAKSKHDVVMTPGEFCYFDHYQADPATEPLAIGGFTNLEKVYSFAPTPLGLTPEESQYILGAQANVWTEYLATPQQVEYMIFPRIMALSEVLWGTAKADHFLAFQGRVAQHFLWLDQKGINYCKSLKK